MHRGVEDVIAGDVEPPEPVVERERQIAYEAARVVAVAGAVEEEVGEVLDYRVLGYGTLVVDDERHVEGVGIGQKPDQRDQGQLQQRTAAKFLQQGRPLLDFFSAALFWGRSRLRADCPSLHRHTSTACPSQGAAVSDSCYGALHYMRKTAYPYHVFGLGGN